MIGPTRTSWHARLLFIGSTAAMAAIALMMVSPPAQARIWVSVGVPFPGYYYGPGSYYGYPPPNYYPYAPPPYPAPPAYYPQPGASAPSTYYPQPGAPAPSAYYPQPGAPAPSAYYPQPGAAPAAASGITYTSKPAFTNAAGQTCREYKTTEAGSGHPIDVVGTACRQADGQWRVVN
jgi:hypothetical protein